jgi:hypothetical protein
VVAGREAACHDAFGDLLMKQPGMVTILTTTTRNEAEVVAALLEASEIFNVIDADDAGQTNPELDLTQFVRVLVREEEADKARQLLADARAAGDDLPPDIHRGES